MFPPTTYKTNFKKYICFDGAMTGIIKNTGIIGHVDLCVSLHFIRDNFHLVSRGSMWNTSNRITKQSKTFSCDSNKYFAWSVQEESKQLVLFIGEITKLNCTEKKTTTTQTLIIQ